ncbi:carbamoyltransferase HypF [Rhodopseudomonas palustris]|uniref:Carbamoyltransferase HypF n=1 Tax=Rhodopseudomonas palustris (strain ATCC BAA-98 / CGA009) TaxID=258594 RepID=Q6NB55_RHOPA|nr:carbamoyltransferase HypF [Rhodopseudomonas palustris]OPF91882.1 carbamoyltransferase HypF [Rhodopseudomonas palustris]PPQ44705.1 carbamoyltransferase HypF [Rhodopseudomonas palustris]QQM02469.1 Carbamoyltransferase HypF [Rhodopseudomonas palustris]RJF60697.1 carbamoyltransferase HypF [Rhodopseudomonas palustris]WAB78657.1 carbamoyltransferase HypF [Rhodopseudomonas palustris]
MQPAAPLTAAAERARVRVRGAVQGVGFRPFVYHLAHRYQLGGFVANDADGVLIEVEGAALPEFLVALRREAPPLARVDTIETETVRARGDRDFGIAESRGGAVTTRIGADAATCEACLDDLFDPASRFHLYPFVNCTHCGPRYTLTRALPYDRANTSMAGFTMCEDCRRDYQDPHNRRFHAEPIACPRCGPQLSHPIEEIVACLRDGRIVALKSLGGYHLLCDATSEAAVAELRRRKGRDAKPFAVMVASEASLDRIVIATEAERALVSSVERPIVLMRDRGVLAPSVAPALDAVGVMLPYTPLHHLIFHAAMGAPAGRAWQRAPLDLVLVATSANLGGDPIVTEDAQRRLASVADLIVSHDRDIVVRADDSVARVIDGAPSFIRRARGVTPRPITLPRETPPVLAVGAYLKNTITLTRGGEAFVSQHVGDLATAETVRFFEEAVDHLTRLVGVKPAAIAHDLHADFASTRFAESLAADYLGLPLIAVQHHHAHVASIAAEHGIDTPLLGLVLDGHGLGSDGGNWGGELLRVDGARFTRLGHLKPLALPGGDAAAREPWRMAAAALHALGRDDEIASRFADQPRAAALAAMLANHGCATTTSAGRLFDAAAGLLGVCVVQSYEGQAAMQLEALVQIPRVLGGGWEIGAGTLDLSSLLAHLATSRIDARDGAELFHGTLAAALAAWAVHAAEQSGLTTIALGGGCFLNRVLSEDLAARLRARGLTPLLARQVPPNDGGLSLGQAWIAGQHLTASKEPH